ncbi:MAG: adenine-specific methyltransferase EcoRI family protein [Prevotella sp.]|nr:adenine-specific methyltransferase EcoRI family protein [Bacteroidales bacterium]MBR5689415.1 adenine-specific methyltransferase EcoRI family protein [Prevotella sp.]
MANETLSKAKEAKNDEFYTQYHDIEREVEAYLDYDPNVFRGKTVLLPCDDPEWSNFTRYFAQNFERLGLKKLISTSYAYESKKIKGPIQLTLFETDAPQFDANKTQTHGKIFVLTKDITGDGRINIDDLEWQYLEGDGDFRSKEVTQLRNEADIIVTNPPFSLFREFLAWIVEAEKKFLIIGNINVITYKEVFPLIKNNKIWTGCRFNKRVNGKNMTFLVPPTYPMIGTEVFVDEKGNKFISVAGTGWFTNLEHGRRHQPLQLMTLEDNLKYSKHKEVKGRTKYDHYDNYNAIEVPYTDAIPSDYDGIMGVPVSFLDKYCPEQFEILGQMANTNVDEHNFGYPFVNGIRKYARILIRKKQ